MSKRKLIWDGLVVLLAIFNSFAVPLEFVYKDLPNNTTYKNIDLLITFIFIADIAVAFNTRYIDVTGEDVRDRNKIASHYMRGDFPIDFISSIPFKLLGNVIAFFNQLDTLKVLKIVRIKRISKLVLRLEYKEEQKALIYISELALKLILILHIIGCLWFFVIDSEESVWAPPIDFVYVQRNEYLRFYDMEEVGWEYQYWVSIYYAMAALGGNEMGSRTNL